MNTLSEMTLKILYIIDDGYNTHQSYLARSKKNHKVRVMNIPNPSFINTESQFQKTIKIGAIDISNILNEISINSPEMIGDDNLNNIDYNLYYKDICEIDEPLVSVGLLSKIRSKLNNELDFDDEIDEESMVITGRVCSNFAAMLRKSYSSSQKGDTKKNVHNLNVGAQDETLEIKLRLIKIISKKPKIDNNTDNISNASNISNKNNNLHNNPVSNNTTNKPTYAMPKKKITKPKRQTNSKPAPKAKRTQSLPLWNIKPSSNGFQKNSIAQRIYMADKLTEVNSNMNNSNTIDNSVVSTYNYGYNNNNNNNISTYTNNNQFPYEMNENNYNNQFINNNNINQKPTEDSISKRFDFMLNKKKASKPKKSSTKTKKSSTNLTNLNTATIDLHSTTNIGHSNNMVNHLTPNDADLDNSNSNNSTSNINNGSNKENIPPIATRMDTKPIENIPTDQLDLNMFNEINWLNDLSNPFEIKNDNKHTPIDNNTNINNNSDNNNHVASNNINHNNSNVNVNVNTNISIDLDKTSPLDTLSMPLMELEEDNINSNNKINNCVNTNNIKYPTKKKITTCQEQLDRLPILTPSNNLDVLNKKGNNHNNTKKSNSNNIRNNNIIIINQKTNSNIDNSTNNNASTNNEEENDHNIDTIPQTSSDATLLMNYPTSPTDDKNNKILPSSPSMMFDYSEDQDVHDLFSSFVNRDGSDQTQQYSSDKK